MRQVTETFNVYRFSELPAKVQQKFLDDNRDFNVDHNWSEFLLEDLTNTLNDIGFEEAEIEYSGFSSQGDGASFTAKQLNCTKLLEKICAISNNAKKFQRWIPKLRNAGSFYLSIETIGHYYSHERTKKVNLHCSIPERLKRIGLVIDDFAAEVEELRLNLSRDIYKKLEAEYDYLTSDQAIRETIEANQYEFLECGKIYS